MDASPQPQSFEFEGFRLDAAARRLTGPGGIVELPPRAFDVLLCLVTHAGERLDKSAILEAVWPDTVVEEGNLSQCIFILRRALGDTAAEPRFIATIPGRGYQFVARVSSAAAADPAPLTRRGSRWLLPAGISLGAALLLFAAWRFWPAAVAARPDDAASAPVTASIAVLPFADLSSAKDMEYFGDGLAEELMSSLSKVRGLRIVSRHSAFAFKGKSDDARTIGQKLGVDTILEGSIRKEGDRIDIKVHLIRTRDGVVLWGEMYDRHFDDVLDLQGSIASEVAATLAPAVRPSQVSGQPGSLDATLTHDPEAYRAYLHGVYLFTRQIDADPHPARQEFLRAVQRDPQFAKAYAMLARTYVWPATLANGNGAQEKSLATDALNRAVKLDPSIGEQWWVKLFFAGEKNGSFAVQATNLERAVAASPTDIEPMIWLAHTYLVLARREEALQMFERAHAADPLSPVAIWNTAWFGFVFHGDRQRLLDLTDEMERLLPRDARANWTRSNLAFSEGRALDWDRFVARVIELNPADFQNHAWLANDYGSVGVYDAALYHARMCAKLEPQNEACPISLARVEMRTGDLAAARHTLSEALARDPSNPRILESLAELQYFTGDCAGMLQTIARARPDYDATGDSLNLFHYNDDVPMIAWCLRRQGETARVAEWIRVFDLQNGPPTAPGTYDGFRARMAAATGNRDALLANLTALAATRCADSAFVRHEPLIQPYLKDAEVVALLDRLDGRRAEWRRILPRASTHVPVPGVSGGAGS